MGQSTSTIHLSLQIHTTGTMHMLALDYGMEILKFKNLFVTNPHASKVNKENLQKAVDKANDVDTSLYTERESEGLSRSSQLKLSKFWLMNVGRSAVDTATQNLNDAFEAKTALYIQVTPDEGRELVFIK